MPHGVNHAGSGLSLLYSSSSEQTRQRNHVFSWLVVEKKGTKAEHGGAILSAKDQDENQ